MPYLVRVHVYQQKDSDGAYEDIELKAEEEEDVTVRRQKTEQMIYFDLAYLHKFYFYYFLHVPYFNIIHKCNYRKQLDITKKFISDQILTVNIFGCIHIF